MIFFTSILSNYLDKSLALAESVLRHHSDCQFRIYLFDFETADLPSQDELSDHLETNTKSLPTFHSSKSTYPDHFYLENRFNIVECCTAVKPFITLRLLEIDDIVVYLDPDTYVYQELDLIKRDSANSPWDIQLIPHVVNPAQGDSPLSERLFANFGIFNLGYLAARKSKQSIKFLQWWASTCAIYGVARPIAGLYVDQKPFDFAPAFIDKLNIIRHPGWNVSWWNLFCDGRNLKSNMKVEMNNCEYDLVFMHFSNLDSDSADAYVSRPLKNLLRKSHHQVAMLKNNAVFNELLQEYKARTANLAKVFLKDCRLDIKQTKRLSLSQQLLDESFRKAVQTSRQKEWASQVSRYSRLSSDTNKLMFAARMFIIYSDTNLISFIKSCKHALSTAKQSLVNDSLWDFRHHKSEPFVGFEFDSSTREEVDCR